MKTPRTGRKGSATNHRLGWQGARHDEGRRCGRPSFSVHQVQVGPEGMCGSGLLLGAPASAVALVPPVAAAVVHLAAAEPGNALDDGGHGLGVLRRGIVGVVAVAALAVAVACDDGVEAGSDDCGAGAPEGLDHVGQDVHREPAG